MNRGEKRVCVLTGASGRLGSAFCSAYASTYSIAAVYRRNPPAVPSQDQRFIDPLNPGEDALENHDKVFAIRADLFQEGATERVAELALAHFGRVDVLVNAAAESVWTSITDPALTRSARRQFVVNTVAPLQLAAALCRTFWSDRMDENVASNRNVINLSSTAGSFVYPDLGQSVYAATKAGLNHLTYHMASELWSMGIRVNAVAPNTFSRFVPIERVTRAIVDLDRGETTGKILVIDADTEYYL